MSKLIQVNDAEFQAAMARYIREYPRDVTESLRVRFRLLFTRISKYLPPKDRKQGVNRVRGDIRKAANPLRAKNFADKGIRDAINSGRVDTIRKVVENSNSPFLQGQRVENFHSSQHRLMRNSRTGRVQSKQNLLVLNSSAWDKYVKFRTNRVGLLRTAFALPIKHLGGKVPAWLSKPQDITAGVIRDELDAKQRFQFTCSLPYADRYESFVRSSMTFETKAMLNDLKLALRRAADKNNL